ncbi:DUF2312 domain-containing protein [Aureimonas ureilytica]|uniref:DUF2312 domain-containing protein n=1 Tax=Aureimonas ureilytica TaxID=401562 RepID=UPI000AD99309|nr:DUF2312 domain-containing protein [Aureimonas ureilytica]
MARKKKTAGSGHNSQPGPQVLNFIERVERVREEKKAYADDEASIFAEAKSSGFDTAAIKRLLKRRSMKPHDLEEMEAIDDVYRHAIGMAKELPLFKAVGTMNVDLAARESVIAALLQLVPSNGEIHLIGGGITTRMWRTEDGEAMAEELLFQPEGPPRPDRGDEAPARRPAEPAPEVDQDGARQLGQDAARDNTPITKNPFPWDDDRRRAWDEGWRDVAGSDGMGPDED